MAMNLTIWLEAATAAVLLAVVLPVVAELYGDAHDA
jgi:hypothetical protein